MKIKLVLVIADSSRTGAPTQVLYLARGISAEKNHYDVHCICPEGWLADELQRQNIQVHRFDNTVRTLSLVRQLRKLYQDIEPDVIHCHGVRAGIVGRLAAYRGPILIYTEHLWTNSYLLLSKTRMHIQLRLLSLMTRKTNWTIAVSHAVEQCLIDKRLARPEKLSVIYGSIEPLKPVSPIDEPVIGTIGSLTWVKGTKILLYAVKQLVHDYPKLRCLVAGDGPDMSILKTLASQLGISDNVEWLGSVANSFDLYRQLRVYVHPSLSESFGMAPLEAMSAGLPVVVSDAGALPEVVKDGESGIVCRSLNYKAFAEKIGLLLADNTLRGQLVTNGRKQAALFSVSRFVAAHHDLYQRLVNDKSS